MNPRLWLYHLLILVFSLSTANCVFHPVELPGAGWAEIHVIFTRQHQNLTVEWKGEWKQFTTMFPNVIGLTAEEDSLSGLQVVPSQEVSFPETVTLRPGLWEFVITASVGDSDVFPPLVCQQEVFDREKVVLTATEGEVNCTSNMGGEGPRAFLWGEQEGTLDNGVFPRKSEAFPDQADNSGDIRLLFLLINRDTPGTPTQFMRPSQVPEIKVAFYDDSAGRPGNRISNVITLPLQQELERRNRVDTTSDTVKGDTWVWFALDAPLSVTVGQTYYLAVLDSCPPTGQACGRDPNTRFLLFYSGTTQTTFQSPNSNETDLPPQWPPGGATFPNSSPLVAFALSQPEATGSP